MAVYKACFEEHLAGGGKVKEEASGGRTGGDGGLVREKRELKREPEGVCSTQCARCGSCASTNWWPTKARLLQSSSPPAHSSSSSSPISSDWRRKTVPSENKQMSAMSRGWVHASVENRWKMVAVSIGEGSFTPNISWNKHFWQISFWEIHFRKKKNFRKIYLKKNTSSQVRFPTHSAGEPVFALLHIIRHRHLHHRGFEACPDCRGGVMRAGDWG